MPKHDNLKSLTSYPQKKQDEALIESGSRVGITLVFVVTMAMGFCCVCLSDEMGRLFVVPVLGPMFFLGVAMVTIFVVNMIAKRLAAPDDSGPPSDGR